MVDVLNNLEVIDTKQYQEELFYKKIFTLVLSGMILDFYVLEMYEKDKIYRNYISINIYMARQI